METPEISYILRYLPAHVARAVEDFAGSLADERQARFLSELRLRADAPFSLTFRGENICRFGGRALLCTEADIASTLQKLCEDSVHTYSETLREGYIALENGFRVGVCGRTGSEELRGLYRISSISIRIPHLVRGVCREILPLLLSEGAVASALFFSPPNVGKTTLIRDLASVLSSGAHPRRVAVIDSRNEMYMRELFADSLADFLRGYPKGKGMEIATRTLSPEAIFCDEIGGREEAEAILTAQNCGVPLLASAHASDYSALLRRPNIRLLREHGVFRYIIGLSRAPEETRFRFDVHEETAEEGCA